VLFASASPVARDDLARVVGQGASVDLLIEDLAVDLEGRPYEVAQVGAGWMLRTRPPMPRRSAPRRMWGRRR
jgi:segregation and condensation protein B